MKNIICLLFLLSAFSIKSLASDVELIDKQATAKTNALFANLKKIENEGKVLFGQQDATLYGRTWQGDKDRSDVKDLCGDHPAVIGLDFASVTTADLQKRKEAKERLVTAVTDTYNRGGVVTFAWHASNPANDGSFYWEQDPIKVVSDLLPEGKLHDKYKQYLAAIADVAGGFMDADGELIPVIFRPFHEFEGDWFWWGKAHCSKEEFISLWRFTVKYLKDDLGVHNFIYAFSPDCRFSSEAEYLDRYPGDEYVDMLGTDNYWDFRPDGTNNPKLAEMKLKIVSDLAARKNKLAAFTETGLESVTQSDWFTATLLPILQKVKVSYVLVWRNAYQSPTHYYAPTVGHAAAEDFKTFARNKNILMESDLPDMYK